MKTKIITSIILFIVVVGFTYLMGSFYYVSFDISQWTETGRSVFVTGALIALIGSYPAADVIIATEQKKK